MIDCKKSQEMMSLYIDGQLSREEQESFLNHLALCDDCKKELEILKNLVNELNEQEFLSLPQGFHEELMDKVNKEKVKQVTFKKANRWKRYSGLAAAFIAVGVIGAYMGQMGGGNLDTAAEISRMSDLAAMPESAGYSDGVTGAEFSGEVMPIEEYEVTVQEESIASDNNAAADTLNISLDDAMPSSAGSYSEKQNELQRKKIKTAYLSIEVESFDGFIEMVETYIDGNNGYIEDYSSYIYHEDENSKTVFRAGHIRARIDTAGYSAALDFVKSLGKVESENEYTEDVTSSYVDVQARLGVKIAEETRLLELMEDAQTIEDIIAIEARLADVRGYIESYEAQLKAWDTRIDYSTIEISIREKQTAAVSGIDGNFGSRIKDSFVKSVNLVVDGSQNLLAGLVTISLPAIILIIIGGGLIMLIRKNLKIKKK